MPTRIASGCHSSARLASFISLASTFLPEELRRAADHHAGDEDRDDDEDQHVDEADADAAEDVVEPHADHRHQPAERRQRVVHRVDRPFDVTVVVTAQSADRPDAEAHFLALHRAGGLVDAHRRNRRVAADLLRDAEHDHREVDREHRGEDHDRQLAAARPCARASHTIAIGMMVIDQVSTKFESGVGFSYGCAEFGPK